MQDFAHESGNTVCPAKRAVFSTLVVTGEMSLFSRRQSVSLCDRRGYFYSTRRQLYYVTIPYGSFIFQLTNKFLCDAWKTPGLPVLQYFSETVLSTTHPRVHLPLQTSTRAGIVRTH